MINEVLSNENKTRFRELAKRFHPDINKEAGSEKLMTRLNSVKDDDDKFIKFYNEVMGIKKEEKKPEPPKEQSMQRPSRFKTDEEWKQWHEKVVMARKKKQEKERKRQRG